MPVNPQATMEPRTSRKRQAPLDDNGEPVTVPIPKRRNVSNQSQKQKFVPAVPSKNASTKRKPSVEIEEVPEEDNPIHPGPPRNPRNILEASDGSDDDNNFGPPSSTGPPSSAAMNISDEEDEIEIVEDDVEDDETELGLPIPSLNISKSVLIHHRTDVQEMVLTRLCVLQENTPD